MEKQSLHRLVSICSASSIAVSVGLLLLKAYGIYQGHSMAMLAGLTDSALDVVASVINFFAIRWAIAPADDEHRFGHGKAEALAGLAQATLIATSSLLLIFENCHRLFHPVAVSHFDLNIMITVVSLAVTLMLVSFQKIVIHKTGNLALRADMLHYQSDIWLNLGILLSLLISLWTHNLYVDSIVSLGIAMMILYSVKDIIMQSIDQIMDKEFPEDDRKTIYELAVSHHAVTNIHDLRTRMSGSGAFIQFHLEMPSDMPLKQAHQICDEVEFCLLKRFPQAEIFIHLDPHDELPQNPLPYRIH